MTAPPGGPYGQDPYGANPYGQDPTQWGGQPQGYPYPQGDPYQQGGTYPYPQGGVNQPGAPGYSPQQYPQPGQQAPPGWSTGSYPPGPPPNRSKLPWLIIAGIAVLGVIALVLILVFAGGKDNKSTNAATTTAGPSPATSEPPNTEQTATDCTPNVSPGDKPTGDMISAGKLSFPASAAPGWEPFADDQTPNLIGAVGLSAEVPGASQWIMQAEVGVTNFVPSMNVSAQASKLMQCIAAGPGYANAAPSLGPTKSSSIKVDGVTAERLEADISIGDTARNVKGDTVTIVAVATKPVTIFMGATPIGDAASAGVINGVIAALKVAKS
ncbi:hypothetical protein A9W99_16280 [Mycobacterium sp. 1164966.3]|uniref:hypothetical protein n=1 Tax=Mycobacterium sp. 1164966.3 TaxID=1856861 RepID=UPI0007FCDC36|nr:hypothetical protein [Mycobacterium sp. 1164966.3]OBA80608.1 hypothetical protein A9W99_16280 [Mycobacterium sp. 1164966.3]